MSQKISDIDALLLEKKKLQERCKEKEQLIGKKLDYIQDNLGLLAIQTILPVKKTEKSSIGYLFDGLHGILQSFLPDIAAKFSKSEKWIKLLEIIASSIVQGFFNKKSE